MVDIGTRGQIRYNDIELGHILSSRSKATLRKLDLSERLTKYCPRPASGCHGKSLSPPLLPGQHFLSNFCHWCISPAGQSPWSQRSSRSGRNPGKEEKSRKKTGRGRNLSLPNAIFWWIFLFSPIFVFEWLVTICLWLIHAYDDKRCDEVSLLPQIDPAESLLQPNHVGTDLSTLFQPLLYLWIFWTPPPTRIPSRN